MAFDPSVVDVVHFLDTLEIRNVTQATAQEMRFSCPFPNHTNGDETASAYMNIESARFYCHGCKERGSVVDFTAYVLSISPLEAVRLLKQAYQPGGINPDARDMVTEVKKILAGQTQEEPQPLLDEDVLRQFEVDWYAVEKARNNGEDWPAFFYMLTRGFGPETLEEWQFGYDPGTDRITIPVRDEKGRLIGFKARAWQKDRNPKYLVLGDPPGIEGRFGWPRYFPSRVVFGAFKIREEARLVVCEGELNAIATTMKTGMPAVAINGSRFSDHHATVLRRIASEVVLFLDSDKAGEEATWGWNDSRGEWRPGIVDRLSSYMPVYVTPPHAQDAASMEPRAIEACIEDASSSLMVRLGC